MLTHSRRDPAVDLKTKSMYIWDFTSYGDSIGTTPESFKGTTVPLNEEWSIFSMEHLWLDWLLNLSSVKDWLSSFDVLFPPPAASSKGQHEITIPAGLPQYCFDGLSPDALYTATVFVQTSNLEGPGVGIKERTRECFSGWTFLKQDASLLSWLWWGQPEGDYCGYPNPVGPSSDTRNGRNWWTEGSRGLKCLGKKHWGSWVSDKRRKWPLLSWRPLHPSVRLLTGFQKGVSSLWITCSRKCLGFPCETWEPLLFTGNLTWEQEAVRETCFWMFSYSRCFLQSS